MIVALMPLAASAQVVNTNTSAAVQQSFLTQLKSLQQELAALEATIGAMISAASGGSSQGASSLAAPVTAAAPTLPLIVPALPSTLSGSSGDDLSATLSQVLASSTTQPLLPVPSTTNTSSSVNIPAQDIGTQLDPSCIASLFGNGAQCGGLYWCSAGVEGGVWSSAACPVSQQIL